MSLPFIFAIHVIQKKFVDDEDRFSLCVLPETYRKELAYCGKVSGRDEDKIAKCGFTVKHNNGVPFFKESRLVINCKKLYAQQMQADCFTKEGKNLPCNTVQRVCCAFWIMPLRKRISWAVIKRIAKIDEPVAFHRLKKRQDSACGTFRTVNVRTD